MLKKRLFISLVLVILGTLVFWKSLSAYKEAGTHLTPASVSVSGYTRRDGTYVRPYNRRPSGGAIHDRPYESAMFLYSVLMLISGGLVVLPIGMMLRSKTHKKSSQESSPPPGMSVLLKCSSRQHTLRLDSNRFWQKTICPTCKVPIDPTRLRRIIKKLSLLFSKNVEGAPALIKKSVIPVLGILALVIGLTLTLLNLRARKVEPQASNVIPQPSVIPAIAASSNALDPSVPNSSKESLPSVRPSPTSSTLKSQNATPEIDFSDVAQPATSTVNSQNLPAAIPSEVPSPTATPVPVTVRYANGTNLIRPRSVGGRGALRISNGTSSDAIAKLVDSVTGKTRRLVYIQAYNDATIGSIGTGNYILKFSLGTGYDESAAKFLYSQSFSRFDDALDFREFRTNEGIRWKDFEVTLNPVINGNAQTSSISAADFEDK